MGIGDWGLGIGDWAQSPIPNPESPIPNPHSLYLNLIYMKYFNQFIIIYILIFLFILEDLNYKKK